VVLVRDGLQLEVLLLARARRRAEGPAAWVFPGGKVELADRAGDPLEDARRAAVREAREEAGLVLAPQALRPSSRWSTPDISPRRFDTWFFLGAADADTPVRVDGVEIAEHRWFAPADALRAHHAREILLAPPTFVTVTWLMEHRAVAGALEVLGAAEPLTFRPQIHRREAGACILYPGDAGYESGDPERAGPRHRLWALAEGYRYERRDS
jgi:8-oxo-dGTP pyrophosphatase MutT (NUDIX family)